MRFDDILAVIFILMTIVVAVAGGVKLVNGAAGSLVRVEQQARKGGSATGYQQLW